MDGISKYMSVILASLEEIKVAIASLSASRPAQPRAPVQGPPITQRELFRKLMKDRGIPSSTIRQVDITLDEMENGR